jgi:hypothetical protein
MTRNIMRTLLCFFLIAATAGTTLANCGDDPGASNLPYAYPIDATPNSILQAYLDAGALVDSSDQAFGR